MNKLFIIIFLSANITFVIFPGGQAETGRDQASASVDQGQLLPVGALDASNYLDDFEIEIENNSDDSLILKVDTLFDSILTKGENISVRISLVNI